MHTKSLQSCPTLCNPVGCIPSGFSVHGILQARIPEWVSMPSSRGSSDPWIEPGFPASAGRFFTTIAAWEAQSYHMTQQSHSWAYIQRKTWFQRVYTPQWHCCLQEPSHRSNLNAHRWMDKEDVVYIIFSGTKKRIYNIICSNMAFSTTWRNMKIIILSEMLEKDIIWYHLYAESLKMIKISLLTKQTS